MWWSAATAAVHLQTRAHGVGASAQYTSVTHAAHKDTATNAVVATACGVRLNLEEVNCQLDTWNGRENHCDVLARLEARTLLRAEHFIPPTKELLSR